MGFYDAHAHTPHLSYCCSPAVTLEMYARVVERYSWLDGVCITNHGFNAYFTQKVAKSWSFMQNPDLFDEAQELGNQRIMDFVGVMAPYEDRKLHVGMEVEMMNDGRLTLAPALYEYMDVIVGSLHWAPANELAGNRKKIWDYVIDYYHRMLSLKVVDLIAHPFRWPLQYLAVEPDEAILKDVVQLLKHFDVAGEINGHLKYNHSLRFLELMLENDVKVALSSDCHSVSEVGDFQYHMGLLDQIGITYEDLRMWSPRKKMQVPKEEREWRKFHKKPRR